MLNSTEEIHWQRYSIDQNKSVKESLKFLDIIQINFSILRSKWHTGDRRTDNRFWCRLTRWTKRMLQSYRIGDNRPNRNRSSTNLTFPCRYKRGQLRKSSRTSPWVRWAPISERLNRFVIKFYLEFQLFSRRFFGHWRCEYIRQSDLSHFFLLFGRIGHWKRKDLCFVLLGHFRECLKVLES